jgi:hypothetical protein
LAFECVEDLGGEAVGGGVVALGGALGGGAAAGGGGVMAVFGEELRAFGEVVGVVAGRY